MSHSVFTRVTAASVPLAGLAALARFRTSAGVRVTVGARMAWVWWPKPNADFVQALMPVAQRRFYYRDGQHWFATDSHIPIWDLPSADDSQPLDQVLQLAPFTLIRPHSTESSPLQAALVPDATPRRTSVLTVPLRAITVWIEQSPSATFREYESARMGEQLWLRGVSLPWWPEAERYWGTRVLKPIGTRLEPDWPDILIAEAVNLPAHHTLVVQATSSFILADAEFRPVDRASLRLAVALVDAQT